MKRMLAVMAVIITIGLFLAPVALAAEGAPPIGTCPQGFHMHNFHDPSDHHHGDHVGLEVDLNNNGAICAKHLNSGKHVHMDDVLITP